MRVGRWIVVGFLGLPAAEILVFIVVAANIGFINALALVVATSLAGALVLRSAGRARFGQFRMAAVNGRIAAIDAQGADLLTVLGGILLLIPGFVTDCLGALLLVPAIRRWIGATLRRVLVPGRSQDSSVVDLERGEWERVPDRELPDRRSRSA
ncbi:MAG TPA: FxsA family protein [Xanthobacteraceae bacterium]|nr:FxsA family protein [Xanthobacteraceae bacterium]